MAGRPSRRASRHAVFSRGPDAAERDCRHCLSEQGTRLRHSLPCGGRNLEHHRRRSKTLGRGDWFLRRAAHVGSDFAAASPPALRRRRRWALSGRHAMDLLPASVLLAGPGSLLSLPASVPGLFAEWRHISYTVCSLRGNILDVDNEFPYFKAYSFLRE